MVAFDPRDVLPFALVKVDEISRKHWTSRQDSSPLVSRNTNRDGRDPWVGKRQKKKGEFIMALPDEDRENIRHHRKVKRKTQKRDRDAQRHAKQRQRKSPPYGATFW